MTVSRCSIVIPANLADQQRIARTISRAAIRLLRDSGIRRNKKDHSETLATFRLALTVSSSVSLNWWDFTRDSETVAEAYYSS